jgi:hypothetical protein
MSRKGTFDDILMTYFDVMHCEHRAKVGYLRLVPLIIKWFCQ